MSDVSAMVERMVAADDGQTGYERCRHMLQAALDPTDEALVAVIAGGIPGETREQTLEDARCVIAALRAAALGDSNE